MYNLKLGMYILYVDVRYSCVSSIPLGCCDWWNFSRIYLKNSQACVGTLSR